MNFTVDGLFWKTPYISATDTHLRRGCISASPLLSSYFTSCVIMSNVMRANSGRMKSDAFLKEVRTWNSYISPDPDDQS